MKFKSVEGYALTTVCGLWIFAMAWLVFGNWGNRVPNFHVYWQNQNQVRLGLLMIGSAAGGVVTYWMVRWLIRGIRLIRRGRMESIPDKMQKMEKEVRKVQSHS